MSADRHQADDRIAAIATKYTSTGEHAKIPLMICVGSGRTSFQGKIQLMDLDGKVIHGDFELPVSDHEHLGVVVQEIANQIRDLLTSQRTGLSR
jgi:hypothetical protein